MLDPEENKGQIGMNAAAGQQEQTPEGVAVLMSAKDMNEVRDAVKIIAGLNKGFSRAFLDQEGMLKDIADKAGREKDREYNLLIQAETLKLVKDFRQGVTDFANRAAQPCEAVLAEEDRKEVKETNGFFHKSFYYFLGWMALASVVLTIGICLINSAMNKSSDLEDWYRQEAETAAFGHFVKKNSPVTYDVWKSGLWPRAVDKQDSIKRLHQYRKWSKKMKYSE